MTARTVNLEGASSPSALNPVRAMLANGAVVVAKETSKTPAVTINIAIRSGAIADPPGLSGAMNLLARTIDRGTATRSATTIATALDGRGISLSTGVTRHLVSLVCTCLAEDFESIVPLLADIVTHPVLPEEELANRRREALTAIAQDDDNPSVRAAEALIATLYGKDHPYGRPLKGSAASVAAVTRQDLVTLYRARYAPSELMVFVVGDVPAGKAVDVVGQAFGEWRAPVPAVITLAPPVAADTRRSSVIPMMTKAQADVAYGFIAVRRSDPAFYACWLMNTILGQYGLGGRLGDSIRERQGMAYYVSSNVEPQVIEGPLLIRAGVSPENVDRAIASIDEELLKLRAHGVTQQEFTETKNFLIGSMPRTLETNAGIASFLQRAEVFGLGLDFDARLPLLLNAVTIDEVNATAVRFVDPSRATIIVAGPYRET